MAIYMGTTEKSTQRTAGDITELLAAMGASGVSVRYNDTKEPNGITFQIVRNERNMFFDLPIRWDGIYQRLILKRARGPRNGGVDPKLEQAKKTAWRQVYRWLQAQAALLEADMAATEEIFMPYLQIQHKGQTMTCFEALQKNSGLLQLGTGR